MKGYVMGYKNDAGIYAIVNQKNGHKYIGSSSCIKRRIVRHRSCLKNQYHPNFILQSAWNKYGPDAFTVVVLENCPNDQLFEREQWYLDTTKPRYNISRLADRVDWIGKRHSDETKKKISIAAKRTLALPEVKAKMSAVHKGKPSGMKGRKHSEASNKKNREAHLGVTLADETKTKIGNRIRGIKRSPETLEKMSSWQKGKPKTEAHRQALSIAHTGTVRPEATRKKQAESLKKNWAIRKQIQGGNVDREGGTSNF